MMTSQEDYDDDVVDKPKGTHETFDIIEIMQTNLEFMISSRSNLFYDYAFETCGLYSDRSITFTCAHFSHASYTSKKYKFLRSVLK